MSNMHSICLIGNTDNAFSPIYNAAITYLGKGYKVIYAAEESKANDILDRFKQADDRTRDYERKKMLVISQPSKLATKTPERIKSHDAVENERYVFLRKYRAAGTRGVVVFSSPENLLTSAGSTQLLAYEKSITENLSHEPISVICCYHRSTFDRLSFGELISLVRQHHWIVYSELKFEVLPDFLILNVVERQLNKVLGPGSSHLVYKTLRLVYGIDDTDSLILQKPELFHSILRRILGNLVANKIIHSITSNLEELITYSSPEHLSWPKN
jgi:hypothetical protein